MMKLIADYLFDKNPRTSYLKFSVSYEKDATKDSEAKQLIKPWPTKTIPNENEPKPLFETEHSVMFQHFDGL